MLRNLVADEPAGPGAWSGPGAHRPRRPRAVRRGPGRPDGGAGVARYLDLVDRLVAFADEPPWTKRAHKPARKVLPPGPRPGLEAAARPRRGGGACRPPPTTVAHADRCTAYARPPSASVCGGAPGPALRRRRPAVWCVHTNRSRPCSATTTTGPRRSGLCSSWATAPPRPARTPSPTACCTHGSTRAAPTPRGSSSTPGAPPSGPRPTPRRLSRARRPSASAGGRPTSPPPRTDLLADLVTWHLGGVPSRSADAAARCGSARHGQPVVDRRRRARQPRPRTGSGPGRGQHGGTVGVDVEPAGRAGFPGFEDVAVHPQEGSREPTGTWVRQEVLLKATGWGLAVDPTTVRLDDRRVVSWEELLPRRTAAGSRTCPCPRGTSEPSR